MSRPVWHATADGAESGATLAGGRLMNSIRRAAGGWPITLHFLLLVAPLRPAALAHGCARATLGGQVRSYLADDAPLVGPPWPVRDQWSGDARSSSARLASAERAWRDQEGPTGKTIESSRRGARRACGTSSCSSHNKCARQPLTSAKRRLRPRCLGGLARRAQLDAAELVALGPRERHQAGSKRQRSSSGC